MSTTTVCRVCLVDNVQLFFIQNHQQLKMYEKLSSAKLNTAEKPQGVCYICSSQLLRCCTFSAMARRSEQILTDMLDKGIEVTHDTILMAVSGRRANVIDLRVTALPVVAINDCESNEPCAVTVIEEPPDRRGSFEDEHFTDESTMHEDLEVLTETSDNEHQYSDEDKPNHDINIHRDIFNNKDNLPSHLSRIHNKDEVNVCNQSQENNKQDEDSVYQCSPENKNSSSLNNKSNSFKSQLIANMQTRIDQKQPFLCKVCERGFSIKHSLTRHMLVHTGEKLHVCKHCNKCFYLKGSLKKHLITHFKEFT